MEPLETTGHSAHAKSKAQEKAPETPQESHILDSQIDTRDMQDPLEPGSSDVDERMSKYSLIYTKDLQSSWQQDLARDFKDAIENANLLDKDRIRHAMPKSSNAWNEPDNDNDISWRPDPSGHPRRTF